MNLTDSGKVNSPSTASTIGTMPPMVNRICQPCVGTKVAATTPGMAPPSRHKTDTDQRERRAVFARRGFGIDRDNVRNDAADAEAGKQAQPEQLLKVGRVGGGEGKYAKQQVRGDQRDFAAVAVADPSEQSGAEKNSDQACAEDRTELAGL